MQIVPVTWCLCLHSRLSTYDLQQSVHSLFLWCLHIFPSQTNQLGVNTYPPHPLLLQPKSITPAKQHFPSPIPSLSLSLSLVSFSSPGKPTQSFLPPSLPSLSPSLHSNECTIPRSARPVLGGGVQGGHTPTPHLQKNKRPSQGVIKTELTMATEANPNPDLDRKLEHLNQPNMIWWS